MRIRPSYKRLHTEEWRPWQLEEYVGCHESRDWVPADDAVGYKFHPCFVVPSPPVNQGSYSTPQTGLYLSNETEETIWERIKKWLLSGGSGT